MPSPWWKSPKEWSLQRFWNAVIEYGIGSGFGVLVTFVVGILGEFPLFYIVIASSIVGLIISTIVTQLEPRMRARRVRTIMTEYQNHTTLSLYEAACLWVGVEPHHPLKNLEAEAKLSYLKSAVRNDELDCKWLPPMTKIHDAFWGIRDKTPTDHQEVSMVALRRYAEKTNNVPLFLRHVSLPVEPPKKEE